jgi:hypothetical protein
MESELLFFGSEQEFLTPPHLMGVLDFRQQWLHSRCDARKRLDEGAGVAGYRVYHHEINETAKT